MTKTFLNEGDKVEIQGSGKKPYLVRKIGGVVDCSCPAWRNLGGPIDNRVCKHIKANIDPACLLPQAQAVLTGTVSVNPSPAQPRLPRAGLGVPMTIALNQQRLTKTGKVSTAHKASLVKSTAPPCLLAHKWTDEDPTGWWVSEKLDGIRAWWDGKKFISRLGNDIHAPQWFKDKILADVVLDGELWIGRKRFQETVSAVRKLVPTDSEWENVKYMVFDAPENGGTFEERYEWLHNKINVHGAPEDELKRIMFLVPQVKCESTEQLKTLLRDFEATGSEGVMLREPGSMYESGRSSTCLKVKTFFDDEAEVIGYTDGKGKHKGRVGALVCKWNGVEFEVGTGLSDEERRNPPFIGVKITFRYQELTDRGVPRFPSYISERNYE
jgi:DNA ligase 1